MSVWGKVIGTAAGLLLGGPFAALAGSAGASGDIVLRRVASPERRQVAFTIAAIALAAKMARADGVASPAEFAAFERLFQVPDKERANATRFYRLAQGSVNGFEAYADQAASLLGAGSPVLEDLLEALLLIAKIDGFHPAELAYLETVAARFGFDAPGYARIRARHLAPAPDDPYAVLDVPPGSDLETVRAAYRRLVKTYHPDRHMAGGTPPEFIRVAEDRMAAINLAYGALTRNRT
ncbi:TerB family tellurite resistance protein [Glacieibacterium sp.]|uniref:TerB family tellurite resistance protein n=1 Tax=Glacieibacterium sp. TaxID=2860237 RepID=UPI003B00654D